MGSLVIAACPCGYESDWLMIGCGFAGPDEGYDLVQCRVCHRFGSSRVSTVHKRCSHCRSRKVRVLGDDVPKESLGCPTCDRVTAVIHSAGLWD